MVLDMTQPAVTRQVRLLEDAVGHRLFDRSARGTRVRAEGEVMVERARDILANVERLTEGLDHDLVRGELKMGIVPTAAANRFPGLYRSLVQRYPALKIDVLEMYTSELVEGVRRGELDLALGTLPLAYSDVAVKRLWREELVAISPTGDPESDTPVSIPDLAHQRFVGFPFGHGLSRRILELFQEHNLQPDIQFEARSIATVIGFVSAGLGISIVPEPLARIYQQASVIHIRRLAPRAYRQMILIYSPHLTLRTLVRTVIRFLETASLRF